MKKIVEISGMSCGHCQASVEKALNAIDGVEAKVELAKNRAIVKLQKSVEDSVLSDAVIGAGFEVISVSEKKGLFS